MLQLQTKGANDVFTCYDTTSRMLLVAGDVPSMGHGVDGVRIES